MKGMQEYHRFINFVLSNMQKCDVFERPIDFLFSTKFSRVNVGSLFCLCTFGFTSLFGPMAGKPFNNEIYDDFDPL